MGKTTALNHHYGNFIEAVCANDRGLQTAEIEESYLSCALCHLGNIAHRLHRKLEFDAGVERFVGDAEANTLLTRTYRKPFVVTDHV